jgi:hypothetical protein
MMREYWPVRILRLTLGVVIAVYSALLITNQIRGHVHFPILVLAAAELVAAILFLIPRAVRVGGISLIIIFILAAAFHISHGEYNVGNLAVYAAAALTVVSGRVRHAR